MKNKNDFICKAWEMCDQKTCMWEEIVLEVITDLMFEYGWQTLDANGCSTIWCLTTIEWIYDVFDIQDSSIKEKKLSIFASALEKMNFDEYWKWYYDKLYAIGFTKEELIYFMKIVDVYGEILCLKLDESSDKSIKRW